jgi:dTDP-4-dehydrorhamnose 3,5-epimerase
MSFNFKKLDIPDVILVEPISFNDDRGYFFENYNEFNFNENGIKTKFIQDNLSYSKKNVLRGLHFQKPPKAQVKLVSVLKGEIFDVAVDLRKNSPTYMQWTSEILSEINHRSLYIPEGFAHGFYVLSDTAYVLYKVNSNYYPELDSGIIWNDSELNISWPTSDPILSIKDQNLLSLKNQDYDFNP